MLKVKVASNENVKIVFCAYLRIRIIRHAVLHSDIPPRTQYLYLVDILLPIFCPVKG